MDVDYIAGKQAIEELEKLFGDQEHGEREEIADEIKKHIPDFKIDYEPDSRQQIADSWPSSIDDTEARNDWNWKHQFDLSSMTTEMLKNLAKK